MKLLARVKERRRKRAERKLESATAPMIYSNSREGRAASAQAQRDLDRGDWA